MEAPDDDIVVGKNKVEIEFINLNKKIQVFNILGKLELLFFILILILFVLNLLKFPFFLDLVYYLDYSEYERHLNRYVLFEGFANFLYFLALCTCYYGSYKIYQKLKNEKQIKAGALFYVFQSGIFIVFLIQYLNFTYFLAILTLIKMIITYKITNPKFKS